MSCDRRLCDLRARNEFSPRGPSLARSGVDVSGVVASQPLPMHHIATVHVLGPAGGSAAALCRGLKPTVDARLWTAIPPAHEVRPGDLVVVDLTDRHPFLEPRGLQPLLGRAT